MNKIMSPFPGEAGQKKIDALPVAPDKASLIEQDIVPEEQNDSNCTTIPTTAQVTVFTSVIPNNLAKRYTLVDGSLKKTSAGQLIRGEYEVVEVAGPMEFAGVLKRLSTKQALCYGLPLCSEKKGSIASCAKARTGDITRTASCFSFPDGTSVLFLDYDPPPDAKPTEAKEVWGTLITICPEFSTAPAVVVSSASGYIHNSITGEQLKGPGGWHIYIFIRDGRDIPRVINAIHERCWVAGYGRYDISAAGSLLDRSFIDTAVGQPERLDFAAGAICDSPLEQRRPEPLVINPIAEPFDTSQLKEVKDVIRLEKLKADARAAISPQSEMVRAAWVKKRVAEDMRKFSGLTPKKREEKKNQLQETYIRKSREESLGNYHCFPWSSPFILLIIL